jgi:putative DNA primase/helicase
VAKSVETSLLQVIAPDSNKYTEMPTSSLEDTASIRGNTHTKSSGGHDGIRRVNLRCASQIVPLPITWLWEGWLPSGKLTILAGAAGTGKTTLALGLAAILTSQRNWPDGQCCSKSGNILIWSSEDNPDDTLVPRLIASGADMARCHFIDGITLDNEKIPFDPAQDIHELNKAVAKIGGVAMLIIDPIVSAVSGDMHRANDVRRALQAVVDFADVHNCAVIGITHFAKGGAGKTPADRVIGSQAFGALARMVLVAAKEEGGSRRVLARAKSNISADDGGLAYAIELSAINGGLDATHVVWEGSIDGTAREILGEVEHDGSGDETSSVDLENLLIDLLTEHGGRMPAKLVKAEVSDAGYSWTAANRAKAKIGIESAKELGKKTGGWHWYLPKKSMERTQKIDNNPEESVHFSTNSCVSSVRSAASTP